MRAQASITKRHPATLHELTLLARMPGQPPAAVRAFTDAERADARAYAHTIGGVVEQLPVRPGGAVHFGRAPQVHGESGIGGISPIFGVVVAVGLRLGCVGEWLGWRL